MKKHLLKRRIIALFIVLVTIISFYVPTITYADVGWPMSPQVLAGSAILIDADTGAILYDKNSNTKAYPASMTKIMTGLLTIENSKFSEIVTFSNAAVKSIGPEDTNVETKVGEKFTVEQSLYALLLVSANEVAYGLAEHVGGSLSNFVNMMNDRAKELGALNTHFNNASGLSDPNHYTTAYDMAMIGRACFSNTTFISIDSYTQPYQIGPTNLTSTTRTITGTNQMFQGRKYYYEYCKGSKTGFTDESGYTLISYAEKDGMRLICVVMKEANIDDRYQDTKTLFDYGFNNFKKVSVANSDVSTLFSNSSYYSSNVYGNDYLDFSVNSTYVDLPNEASITDMDLKLDSTTVGDLSNVGNKAMKVKFTYKGYTIGNGNLYITAKKSAVNSNLPYLESSQTSAPVAKKYIVINVWFLFGGILLFIIFIYTLKYVIEKFMRRK